MTSRDLRLPTGAREVWGTGAFRMGNGVENRSAEGRPLPPIAPDPALRAAPAPPGSYNEA